MYGLFQGAAAAACCAANFISRLRCNGHSKSWCACLRFETHDSKHMHSIWLLKPWRHGASETSAASTCLNLKLLKDLQSVTCADNSLVTGGVLHSSASAVHSVL